MAKPSKKRPRPHGHLPAGYQWRNGRPAWIPSPTRRKQGWKRCDLRDAWGRYVDRPTAIARAEAIAKAVAAWAEGEPVPAAYAAFAPAGAGRKGATPGQLSPRSIGALLDGYYASDRFLSRAAKTQSDYRSKIARLLGVVACPIPPLDARGRVDRDAVEAKVQDLRGEDIDLFEAPVFGQDGECVLEEAYEVLCEQAGLPMAYGVMAAASAWFGWCVKRKRIWAANPVRSVERLTPEGRIRVGTWEELQALVASADALGRPSIGDAVVLAIDLSWGQQDLLALTWGQISADGCVRHRRIKTGVAGNPPLLPLGRARLAKVEARWKGRKVAPTHVLVCEETAQAWSEHAFRHVFAEVRAHAALSVPSVADLQFRDLRDTAITIGIEAGLTLHEICSRSLHQPTRAQAVIDKHYGAIRQEVADGAAEKLGAHLARKGWAL